MTNDVTTKKIGTPATTTVVHQGDGAAPKPTEARDERDVYLRDQPPPGIERAPAPSSGEARRAEQIVVRQRSRGVRSKKLKPKVVQLSKTAKPEFRPMERATLRAREVVDQKAKGQRDQ